MNDIELVSTFLSFGLVSVVVAIPIIGVIEVIQKKMRNKKQKELDKHNGGL